jgi:putative transposase
MPWTASARRQYARPAARYATDLTDAEFALLAPHLPAPSRLGRPREVDLREVLDAILYLLRTGCPWRLLPKEFPPESTVFGYFRRLWEDGTWPTLHALLVMAAREQAGREASPTAGIIDSQSVRTTEAGGPRGYDAGKKVNGRKRHILVDTLGLLLVVVIHAAGIQDRDGLALVCRRLRRRFPWLRLIFADGGYRGETAACAAAQEGLRLQIVTREPGTRGLAVLPRRWVVERTFAWLGRNRRLAKDFESTVTSALTMVHLASVQLLVRRLARA